jgi:two-component system nitrogen regulation response regulator NtrX
MINILVVDDEKDIRDLIAEAVEDNSWTAIKAASSDECLKLIEQSLPDLMILDIWLQGSEMDGLGVLEILQAKYPFIPVIIISGHGNIDTAVRAIKLGAYDYLEKPFSEDKLIILIKRALESSRMKKELFEYGLKNRVNRDHKLLGCSAKIKALSATLEKIAYSNSRVLITGLPGSGKRFAAEFIHESSKRANEPFIEFDPTGLSEAESLSKLFGDKNNYGLLELADKGTLFIREITELNPTIQVKLLQFIQTQKAVLVGKGERKLDIRIISSTSREINDILLSKKIREDLFYRLNVASFNWPSLSERIEDLPFLVDYFLENFSSIYPSGKKKFSQETILLMQCYNWPGNVRELKNTIEWSLIMLPKDQEVINVENLPPDFRNQNNDQSRKSFDISRLLSLNLKDAREIFETEYLRLQLIRFNGNITLTANNIGMERSALHRKLKYMNINNDETQL